MRVCVCVCVERRGQFDWTYGGIHLAGADAVVVAHPAVVVVVLSLVQDVLVSHEVGLLITNPVAAADADGVAAVEVLEGVHAIAVALPVAAREVAALVEDDLSERERERERVSFMWINVDIYLTACSSCWWTLGGTVLPVTHLMVSVSSALHSKFNPVS